MKKITDRLEDIFVDITFAEEREIKPVKGFFKRASVRLEDMLVEIVFAEERNFMSQSKHGNKQDRDCSANGLDHCCIGKA